MLRESAREATETNPLSLVRGRIDHKDIGKHPRVPLKKVRGGRRGLFDAGKEDIPMNTP